MTGAPTVTLIDTHIWVWAIHNDPRLTTPYIELLSRLAPSQVAISTISLWEVAMLESRGRLQLGIGIAEWFHRAIEESGIQVMPLSPEIATVSTRLPGEFHKDPADRIIIATALVNDIELVTLDEHILNYPHVRIAGGRTAHPSRG